MSGYYKNARSTSEAIVDGWMRSGDLGKLDADGFLYIVGRKKDLIIRGGANIYPVDIEEVLYSHQAVGECAVVGVPDQTFGEVVKAFVVIREGMDIECSALLDYCRCHIAEYKVPSQIEIVGVLPKGATGKILRGRLRDMPATRTS
jgi:long-chain acyl-CoA synthetase